MSLQLNLEGDKEVPPEVRGWNWGAFMLTWIWGICNGTLISLLSLIPGIHLIMMFVLGAKGNEWAWRNKNWQSVEQFQRSQRKWAVWGLTLWGLGLGLAILLPVALIGFGVSMEMPEIKKMIVDFEPQRKYVNYALQMAERDPRYNGALGAPLRVRGPAEAINRNGYTEISVPVAGPRGEGTMFVRTRKDNAEMRLERAELELQNMERMRLDTRAEQIKEIAEEHRIVKLEAAVRAETKWKRREPSGKAEAEEFYKEALKRIEKDKEVKQFLGDRISAQVENATVNFEGPAGEAKFCVDLQGNGQDGRLVMDGRRSMGRWDLEGAQLEVQGRVLRFPAQELSP